MLLEVELRLYLLGCIPMHLQALYTYADKLQEVKADKEQVAMEMDVVCLKLFALLWFSTFSNTGCKSKLQACKIVSLKNKNK